ncbi:MAG: hypothetical protein U0Y96_15585 [Candidatus Kapaibacterium sp.]
MKRILLMLVLIVSTIGLLSCSSDTPTNTTPTNSFTVSGTSFSNVIVTCNSVGGGYVMNAGDLGGTGSSCSVAFPTTAMPTAGTYNVDGSGAGQIAFAVVVNTESFAATGGSATVTLVGGKVKVVCTNVPLMKVADPSVTKTLTATIQCN